MLLLDQSHAILPSTPFVWLLEGVRMILAPWTFHQCFNVGFCPRPFCRALGEPSIQKLRPSVLGNTLFSIIPVVSCSFSLSLVTYGTSDPSFYVCVCFLLPSLGFLILLPGKVPQLYLLTILFLASLVFLSSFKKILFHESNILFLRGY